MKNKNIAIVVGYFPTISETFIVNQINGLMDAGWNVRLLAYNKIDVQIKHQSFDRHDLLQNVNYFLKPPVSKVKRLLTLINWTAKHFFTIHWSLYFKSLNIFKYGKEAFSLKLFYEAQWFLLPYDFNIIHAHFGMNGNRIAYLKSKGIIPEGIKLITTFHGYDLEPKKLKEYENKYRNLWEEADAFTVNTPYLESILSSLVKIKTPSYILPVGLDTDYFKRTTNITDKETFDLVFCGKLIPLKGPDVAIEILKRLHQLGHKEVRLHIIGKGKLENKLKELVRVDQMQDSILFYGALSQEEVKNRFEQADVFVLPGRPDPITGRAETQGLVIQEAQAMQLPVVVSDVGGMPFGLLPNESGFVVPKDDIEGFARTLQKLILNPELRIKMGKTGRRFAKNYDTTLLSKKLIKIYEEINECI